MPEGIARRGPRGSGIIYGKVDWERLANILTDLTVSLRTMHAYHARTVDVELSAYHPRVMVTLSEAVGWHRQSGKDCPTVEPFLQRH